MLKKLRIWLLKPELDAILSRQEEIENEIGRRVAETILQMDPWEPLMRQFHGVFSQDRAHPEQDLNAPSQIQLEMLGYKLTDDPSFKYLTEWIMNQHGNMPYKSPHLNRENGFDLLLYAKGQIAATILLTKELGRLSSLYQDRKKRMEGGEEIISTNVVE